MPPNILFIFSDDQAAWTMGPRSDPQFVTPNLDRVWKQGAWFANAFVVTPVCSPSRGTLLTGLYGNEHGLTEWIHLYKEPGLGLDPKFATWPRLLKQAGYSTGLVGKWHLGRLKKFHPRHYGFDYYMGTITARDRNIDPVLEVDGQRRQMSGYMPDLHTDHAVKFLHANKDRPFVLCVNYRVPHKGSWGQRLESDFAQFRNRKPAVPNPDYPGLDVPRVEAELRSYLNVVHVLDRCVGRLLDTLDELKLSERTIVIHTSDHGFNIGHHALSGKGNADWILTELPQTRVWPDKERPNLFDTSIRVPVAVRWPSVVQPGSVISQTVSNLDWFPTLLSMGGVKMPPDGPSHGRDLTPLLRGEPVGEWDDELYVEYSIHADPLHDHMRAWRTPRWKLVRHFTWPQRDEFFDLAADPDETTNLIDSDRPDVRTAIERLHVKILQRMHSLNDPVLEIIEQER